jgi:hypothetical protein
MKEACVEGVATHADVESCASVREDDGEALTVRVEQIGGRGSARKLSIRLLSATGASSDGCAVVGWTSAAEGRWSRCWGLSLGRYDSPS